MNTVKSISCFTVEGNMISMTNSIVRDDQYSKLYKDYLDTIIILIHQNKLQATQSDGMPHQLWLIFWHHKN